MSAAWWARAACLAVVASSLAGVPTANAAPLRLETTFGEGGIARVPLRLAQTDAELGALRPVRQPDGKVLLAAGASFYHGNSQILLARFTRSGRPDPTFGHRGWEHLGLRWNFVPSAVQVQPDGRILVLGAAGYSPFMYPSPGQFALVRLLPDGSRDRTFGTNGFVAWNPPWRADAVRSYALPGLFIPQGGGKLLAAGVVHELVRPFEGSGTVELQRVVFVRFDENGSVDESFGRAGVIEGPGSPNYFGHWAALPDGRIAALASRNEESGPTTWLYRFNPDGTPDRGFGQDGSVRLESFGLSWVRGLKAAGDGSLVMIGNHQGGRAAVLALGRILPAGQLDTDFGSACARPSPRAFPAGAAAVTSDGGLLVSGTTYVINGRTDSLFVRYDKQGCAADRPLRIRAVSAGPPLLQARRTALIGATYNNGLALIRIRR
jgi:uncharacterized delta-60 repeat protein